MAAPAFKDTEMKMDRPLFFHVVVADVELKGMRLTNGQRVVQMSFEDFLNGGAKREFPGITLLLIESAHMAERKKFSLAQIYDAEERILFRKNYADIEVRLLPEMMAKNIRGEDFDKDHSADAWWHYSNVTRPEFASHFMKWTIKTPEELAIEELANEHRFDATVRQNIQRYCKYTDDDSYRALDILDHAQMSDNLLYWTGYYRGPRGGLKWRETFVMPIFTITFCEDGSLRRGPDGRVIGRRWLWKVLKMHPYHRKAGTARSNLMHHVLRNVEKKVAEGREPRFADIQATRASFRKAIKELHRIFVNAGSRAPALSVG